MTDYPDEAIRGISRKDEQHITPEGYVTQEVFKFDDYDPERADGFCEMSINWVDDEGAIDVLLRQINPRKGIPQFQGGYCRFARNEMHIALKSYFKDGYISYERRPLEADEINAENKYHGNILVKNDVSKPVKTIIRATLASLAGAVIPRKDVDS